MLRIRNRYLFIVDVLVSVLAYMVSIALIYPVKEFGVHFVENLIPLAVSLCLYTLFRFLFGIYRVMWRSINLGEITRFIVVHASVMLVAVPVHALLTAHHSVKLALLGNVSMVMAVAGVRFAVVFNDRLRRRHNAKNGKRVLIVGAGNLGTMLVRDIGENKELDLCVVGFVDDDPDKQKKFLLGKKVFGTCADIPKVCEEKNIKEIIFALHSIEHSRKLEILDICSRTGLKVRVLPGVEASLSGRADATRIRDIDIEDLLERDPITLDNEAIANDICGRVVMVTGGGGSIGSELCRQIIRYSPKLLVIVDIYENTTYTLQQELEDEYGADKIAVIIASIRDRARLEELFDKYRPEFVFNAAAHKHVPLMEFSPCEAIKNNIFGTYNIAQCAEKYGVLRFVQISTDKAVNPTNVMGASKRVCEMIVQAMSKGSKTQFAAVRFGNVLGSNGSVVPRFKAQIEKGGPVTVTHKDITRYFMTIPEAAQLVLQAASYACGGEIFVLDMGKPVKIYDMAEKMIRLSGFEPHRDIKIEIVGLRAGEKLYEELLMSEEGLVETAHKKIFIGKLMDLSREELQEKLSRLEAVIHSDSESVKRAMAEVVPTYQYNKDK